MTVVMVARLAIVPYISCKVRCNEFCHITATATDHLNSLSLKDILRSLSHISGKHHGNPHLPEDRSDTALAATAFRRGKPGFTGHLTVNDIENSIICAVSEMIVHSVFTRWNSNLHMQKFSSKLAFKEQYCKSISGTSVALPQ